MHDKECEIDHGAVEVMKSIPYYGEDNMGAIPPIPVKKRICHDCGAKYGELHQEGCDMERCPTCGEQLIGCDCPITSN